MPQLADPVSHLCVMFYETMCPIGNDIPAKCRVAWPWYFTVYFLPRYLTIEEWERKPWQ